MAKTGKVLIVWKVLLKKIGESEGRRLSRDAAHVSRLL